MIETMICVSILSKTLANSAIMEEKCDMTFMDGRKTTKTEYIEITDRTTKILTCGAKFVRFVPGGREFVESCKTTMFDGTIHATTQFTVIPD
jgi:hypothetical protein